MFDEEARRQLLSHFGFSAEVADNGNVDIPEEENVVTEELANLSVQETSPVEEPKAAPVVALDDSILGGEDDGEDFFDKLETPQTPTEPKAPVVETSAEEGDVEVEAEAEAAVAEPASLEAKDDGENGPEEAIQRALVAGDFKVAVDHCLAAGRLADALVMAAVGGTALWEKTQQEYFRRTHRPYLKVSSDFTSLLIWNSCMHVSEIWAIVCLLELETKT
jgi:protein transport protein SEC31